MQNYKSFILENRDVIQHSRPFISAFYMIDMIWNIGLGKSLKDRILIVKPKLSTLLMTYIEFISYTKIPPDVSFSYTA